MGNNGFMMRQWEELKKAGSATFDVGQMRNILQGGDETVLSRDEVLDRVMGYFSGCVRVAIEESTGEQITTWVRNPTKSGLAICLGIDKQTLLDYVKGVNSEGKKFSVINPDHKRNISVEDFDILRKAYSLIENFYEEQLALNKNNAGVIYWLNNASNTKWSNEQEFKFGTLEQTEKPALSAIDFAQRVTQLNEASAAISAQDLLIMDYGENETMQLLIF